MPTGSAGQPAKPSPQSPNAAADLKAIITHHIVTIAGHAPIRIAVGGHIP